MCDVMISCCKLRKIISFNNYPSISIELFLLVPTYIFQPKDRKANTWEHRALFYVF